MALDTLLINSESSPAPSPSRICGDFCEYLQVCDEGYCGSGCYSENVGKCPEYRNFLREERQNAC